jgi:hypothetical protein
VAVAGSLSPLGTIDRGQAAGEPASDEQLRDVYGEPAALLADAGVDLTRPARPSLIRTG